MPIIRVGSKFFEWAKGERKRLEELSKEQTSFFGISYSKLTDEVAEHLKRNNIRIEIIKGNRRKKDGFRLF